MSDRAKTLAAIETALRANFLVWDCLVDSRPSDEDYRELAGEILEAIEETDES